MGENNVLKLIEYYMLLFMYVLKSTILQPFVEWIDTRIEMNPTLVHSLEQVNAGMVHVNESDDDYGDSEVDMRDDYLRENVDDMVIESSENTDMTSTQRNLMRGILKINRTESVCATPEKQDSGEDNPSPDADMVH